MMEHDHGSIRKLASSSLRLNVVLLCAVSLALMLVGACYWALGRVVQEERDKVHFHFTRLVGASPSRATSRPSARTWT